MLTPSEAKRLDFFKNTFGDFSMVNKTPEELIEYALKMDERAASMEPSDPRRRFCRERSEAAQEFAALKEKASQRAR